MPGEFFEWLGKLAKRCLLVVAVLLASLIRLGLIELTIAFWVIIVAGLISGLGLVVLGLFLVLGLFPAAFPNTPLSSLPFYFGSPLLYGIGYVLIGLLLALVFLFVFFLKSKYGWEIRWVTRH